MTLANTPLPEPAAPLSEPPSIERIAIDSEWFFRVDSKGYLHDPCSEGAFGCVLQLRNTKDPTSFTAMKIPRLLADTHGENAYVDEIVEREADLVYQVTTKAAQGLLTWLGSRRPLKNPFRAPQSQESSIVLFCFEKGRKPRAAALHFDSTKPDGELRVQPESLTDEIVRGIKHASTLLCNEALRQGDLLGSTLAIYQLREATSENGKEQALPANENHIYVKPLSTALTESHSAVWYAGLPSVHLTWAKSTLQETISKRLISRWTLDKYCELFQGIVKGVHSLHAHGIIHGDVRPANIMTSGDAEDEQFYRLSDYGSFHSDRFHIQKGDPAPGMTVGVGLDRQRLTPFYAPERGSGVQRESANTAIIMVRKDSGPAKSIDVVLCWKSDAKSLGDAAPEESRTNKSSKPASSPYTDHELHDDWRRGDYLRVRDYVFRVIENKSAGERVMLVCEPFYLRILHERIGVQGGIGELGDGLELSIPSYIQYFPLSTATDTYGIGAVMLYCLYTWAQSSSGSPGQIRSTTVVDDLFAAMMHRLADPGSFKAVWKDLDLACVKMKEMLLSEDRDRIDDQWLKNEKIQNDVTYWNSFIAATNGCVQIGPGVRDILAAMKYNVAHFLFFMHIVLRCLHRTDRIQTPIAEGQPTPTRPFCDSRGEGISPIAAQAVSDELKHFRQYVVGEHGFFSKDAFRCKNPDSEVPLYKQQSDAAIRIDNQRLEGQLKQKGEESDRLRSQLDSLAVRVGKLVELADSAKKESRFRRGHAVKGVFEEIDVLRDYQNSGGNDKS